MNGAREALSHCWWSLVYNSGLVRRQQRRGVTDSDDETKNANHIAQITDAFQLMGYELSLLLVLFCVIVFMFLACLSWTRCDIKSSSIYAITKNSRPLIVIHLICTMMIMNDVCSCVFVRERNSFSICFWNCIWGINGNI